ncbi:MAG: hypothetical protein OXQ90_12970, partial [Gammaproteobacteria bacterium]|nr:hypothetical protein [Gammaproteobacteria bacterium]
MIPATSDVDLVPRQAVPTAKPLDRPHGLVLKAFPAIDLVVNGDCHIPHPYSVTLHDPPVKRQAEPPAFYSRGSTGSDSMASTAKTHSC